MVNFCIIIGDANQFIGHCLIPLNHCMLGKIQKKYWFLVNTELQEYLVVIIVILCQIFINLWTIPANINLNYKRYGCNEDLVLLYREPTVGGLLSVSFSFFMPWNKASL